MSLTPRNGYILNTLGVAQYRAERYGEALETLQRSNELGQGKNYVDAAFMAMSHALLGHIEEAQAELQRLRGLLQSDGNVVSKQTQAFLHEAEALVTQP